MKTPPRRFSALATSIALLVTASAPFVSADGGRDRALEPADILRAPAPQSSELLAFDMNRTITHQTQLLRYQATEYQRKIAEQRARAFVAAHHHAPADSQPVDPHEKPAKSAPDEPQKTVSKRSAIPPPEKSKVAEEPAELPRYIAVDTIKDQRASPEAKKVVMIFDTKSETLVGNNLYDVKNPPRVGATAVFETYSAAYIGAGL